MPNQIAINIDGLGKFYNITHQKYPKAYYKTLRETLMDLISFNRKKGTKEEFWALRDFNLNIKKGEKVAIIGRNGAGKSTLLKLLSRITEPSTGRVSIEGRVASLLEVGTGLSS